MKDEWIHTLIAITMMFVWVLLYNVMPMWMMASLIVIIHWWSWELGQRVAKDPLKQGVLYWWNMRKWSDTARKEAIYPMIAACITGMLVCIFLIK